jgi:hypothetical protein
MTHRGGEFENLAARDVLMVDNVRRQAEALGLAIVREEVEALARAPEIVAIHFGPMLKLAA